MERGRPDAFHVPTEWLHSEDFARLVRCVGSDQGTTSAVAQHFTRLGYRGCGGDNGMARDYIVYLLRDLLDKNFEVYLTRDEIQGAPPLLGLFGGTAPDLLVKSSRGRCKPGLVHVRRGIGEGEDLTPRFKGVTSLFELFAVHPANLQADLQGLLPSADVAYAHRHFQLFMVYYMHWKACITLDSSMQRGAPCPHAIPRVPRDTMIAARFAADLTAYAEGVLDQSLL